MKRVAPVKLKYNSRTLWFDPDGVEGDLLKGETVVVSTARGLEMGQMADDVIEVDDERIKKLKSPLKPVERRATDEDILKAAEMERLSAEALPVFKEMAAQASEDMHPVAVEYLLDGDRAVFYFEAEDRIDFRELVRKLASHFHVRVDMRQIGVRDEARMVGGLGHCGQELCCKRLGGEFCPVSIRMAKEQDLSLNPQKISGVCGRLMCCLRYEFDAYKDFKSRAPKKNAVIETPEGPAKVSDLDVPREIVSLKTEDGQTVKVPLSSFEPAEQGSRPREVGQQAWDEATAPAALSSSSAAMLSTQSLSGKDKLAKPGSVRLTGGKAKGGSGSSSQDGKPAAKGGSSSRKPRRRSKVQGGSDAGAPAAKERKKDAPASKGGQSGQGKADKGKKQQASQGQKPRKRRSTPAQEPRGEQQAKASQGAARPGRKSSALRQRKQDAPQQDRQERRRKDPGAASPEADGAGRRSRRRSHKAHGGHEEGAGADGATR